MEDSQAEPFISVHIYDNEDSTVLLPVAEIDPTDNVPEGGKTHNDHRDTIIQRRSSRLGKTQLWQQEFFLTKREI